MAKMSFQEYQRLTEGQRQFYMFEQLCRIDEVCDAVHSIEEDISSRFAAKWVEWLAKGQITIVLTGFLVALMTVVWPQK